MDSLVAFRCCLIMYNCSVSFIAEKLGGGGGHITRRSLLRAFNNTQHYVYIVELSSVQLYDKQSVIEYVEEFC